MPYKNIRKLNLKVQTQPFLFKFHYSTYSKRNIIYLNLDTKYQKMFKDNQSHANMYVSSMNPWGENCMKIFASKTEIFMHL